MEAPSWHGIFAAQATPQAGPRHATASSRTASNTVIVPRSTIPQLYPTPAPHTKRGTITLQPTQTKTGASPITPATIAAPILATAAVQFAATSAAWLLRAREQALRRHLPYIVSLAVGVLLATALLHLLPEAVQQLGNRRLTWTLTAAAIIGLFAAERLFFVLSGTEAEPEVGEPCAHHQHQHTTPGARPSSLILASMLHSFVDGAAVAVAFLASPRLGWLTALAIALHEIPHRMGDFALLVHLKVPLPRALRLIAYAGLPSFLGLAAVLIAGLRSSAVIAWLLPLSAGSFLYIGLVNLMPELERESRLPPVLLQLTCLCAGAALVVLVGGLGG